MSDLATARILGEDLDAIVSYHDRLLKAADDAGVSAVTLRDRPVHGSDDATPSDSQEPACDS